MDNKNHVIEKRNTLNILEKIDILEKNTKKSINLMHRPNNAFASNFELGALNYETPLSVFVKNLNKPDENAFLFHKEILVLNDKREQNNLFIFKDEVLITKADLSVINNNPLLFRFNHRCVIT